jgi:hypothetical protein
MIAADPVRTLPPGELSMLAFLLSVLVFHCCPAYAAAEEADPVMKRALEEEAAEVAEQYSSKPINVKLGSHSYRIPANYFGPKGRDQDEKFDAEQAGYFGFSLFLPDYGGYTRDNWRNKFDPRLITVLRVQLAPLSPARYYEPRAMFDGMRPSLETAPSLRYYGLEGYRPKYGRDQVTWTGTRSNGEFLFFRCHLAPGDSPQPGIVFPFCDVRYYSEKEQLVISYRYPNANFSKWREIDDAIWAKLHTWEQR